MSKTMCHSGGTLVSWECPKCGEESEDIINQHTHCPKCGRVVFILDEDEFDDRKYELNISMWY